LKVLQSQFQFEILGFEFFAGPPRGRARINNAKLKIKNLKLI